MQAYVISIREKEGSALVAHQQMSPDAGSFQRRNLAEKMIKRLQQAAEDLYVIEMALSDEGKLSVINKYEVA